MIAATRSIFAPAVAAAILIGNAWAGSDPPPAPRVPAGAARAVVTKLLAEEITEYPGHELTMITVTYPPGGGSLPHRHDAYVLLYVLDGAVEMKIQGSPLRVVRAGQTFVEHPRDIHEVSRNASADEPATFLVVALKESARPLSQPVPAP